MINIAIDERDTFFRSGLVLFLEDILSTTKIETVQFESLTKMNAIQADVVVKSFVAGAQFNCHPILKYRRKLGLIIGIYESDENPHHDKLPLCIKNIIFIARSESLSSARKKISYAWKEIKDNPVVSSCNKCAQCKYRTLTAQQARIAKFLLHGDDLLKISQNLNISLKTVSAHKRQLMKRFNLNSDCELLRFLNDLKESNQPIYLI